VQETLFGQFVSQWEYRISNKEQGMSKDIAIGQAGFRNSPKAAKGMEFGVRPPTRL
jgi:hypothetical protein